MQRSHWVPIIAMAAAVALPVGWAAAEQTGDDDRAAGTEEEAKTASSPLDSQVLIAANMPVFVPPNRGAPPMRLGGATRSAHLDPGLPRIEALVPEEPGWTLEAQPVLYWYLEKPTDVPLEFGLQRVDPLEQVVKKRLPAPTQGGIQRIRLADYGVKLKPNAVYFWFVKLAPDPDDPEQDKIVGGGIQRVPTSKELAAQLDDPQASRPHAFAKAGIWYDAVDAYSQAIDSRPADGSLRQQREALLEQVDIRIEE